MERGKSGSDIHAPCREQIATLKAVIERLERRIQQQDRKIEELEARLNQNSRNSSRPPSSDPPSAPSGPSKPPTGRKPGGQPGHEGHQRALVRVKDLKEIVELVPDRCGRCGKGLKGEDPDPLRHQVTELPDPEGETTEYRRHRLGCVCGHTTMAELPRGVPEGAFGPRLEATLAYLTGVAHLSKRQVEEVMRDLFGVSVSLGSVVRAQQAVSEAVTPAVEEAAEYIEKAEVVHSDETGWKEGLKGEGQKGRKKAWLWVAVTTWVTVFRIHAKRGAEGARALLGRFSGWLVSDRWNGYNGWKVRKRQICWAHLIRDFVGFTERGRKSSRMGQALLAEAKKVFECWQRVRDGTMARSTFRVYMGPLRRRVKSLLGRGTRCGERKTEGMCQEMLKVEPALWTFVRIPGVEPTNNRAERAIRPAVLYRKNCFGTQSEGGSRFVERIMTVVATLRQQGRNVMEYLTQACQRAHIGKGPASLLPATARGGAA